MQLQSPSKWRTLSRFLLPDCSDSERRLYKGPLRKRRGFYSLWRSFHLVSAALQILRSVEVLLKVITTVLQILRSVDFIVYALILVDYHSIANTVERGILLKTITAAFQILRSVGGAWRYY